jgi:hypothetical protein
VPIDPIEETLWSYVRGDMDDREFEAWAYATPGLETALGETDYVAIVGADYANLSGGARYDHVKLLQRIVTTHFPRRCRCPSIPNRAKTELGVSSPVEICGDVVARRTPSSIRLVHCKDCGADWLVGTDTIDDQIYLYRLSNTETRDIVANSRWPTIFEDHPNLWPDTPMSIDYVSRYDWPYFEDNR